MHPNEQVIRKFYEAFHSRDAAGMNACYHPNVVFTDPAFGRLEGRQAFAMWAMLCSRAKDLQVTAGDIRADENTGSAYWEAKYSFGPKRRPVHNVVSANFVFRDGKIIEHTDSFSMWKWSGMAIGLIGILFGWTSFLKSAIQKSANRQLNDYMQRQSA
ncbi:MAG: nuclear transport factor 2 family protein [Chloroflexi bacterium]|nr:nuclear transport factor 2 family protein [Chloroflexota bacterium]